MGKHVLRNLTLVGTVPNWKAWLDVAAAALTGVTVLLDRKDPAFEFSSLDDSSCFLVPV